MSRTNTILTLAEELGRVIQEHEKLEMEHAELRDATILLIERLPSWSAKDGGADFPSRVERVERALGWHNP